MRGVFGWIGLVLYAQRPALSNWGEVIRTTPGTIVSVQGSMTNRQGGLWYHSGALYVTDTIDNQAGNEHFRASFPNSQPVAPGKVQLWGDYQWITGTDPIHFDTLELRGTSSKHLGRSAYVRHWLDLGNHMLSTHAETLYHWRADPTSIVRGTGFVQSDVGGALQRLCLSGQTYVYPLGDSVPVLRYRPIQLTPSQDGLYNARFANRDATTEGYPRSQHHPAFCLINPDYFHHISGPATAKVALSYEPGTDPPYDLMAHWTGSLWDSAGGQVVGGVPLAFVEEAGLTLSPTPFALGLRRPTVALLPPGPIDLCPGDSTLLSVSNPNPNYLYTWNTGHTGPTLWVHQPGLYTVVVHISGVSACADSASVEVRGLPAPAVQIMPASPQSICPGGSLTLTTSPPSLSYQWFYNGAPITGATQASLTVSQPGLYTVQAQQVCGLAESDPFLLFHYDPPQAYFVMMPTDSVELGQPVVLTDSSQGGVAYLWVIGGDTFPGSPTYTHAFGQAGLFWVYLISRSPEGCLDTFARPIYVRPFPGIFIPTAFTPNGDGVNDIFLIVAPPLQFSRLRIYDRWGMLIWETQELPPRWDGRTQAGEVVPEGVYAFVWEGQLFSGQALQRSGTITVLR